MDRGLGNNIKLTYPEASQVLNRCFFFLEAAELTNVIYILIKLFKASLDLVSQTMAESMTSYYSTLTYDGSFSS